MASGKWQVLYNAMSCAVLQGSFLTCDTLWAIRYREIDQPGALAICTGALLEGASRLSSPGSPLLVSSWHSIRALTLSSQAACTWPTISACSQVLTN